MNIQEMENKLFEKWSKNHKGFVTDGVVNEKSYIESTLKTMFILKEVNDSKKESWDLRKFISKGARPQTWNNIARWNFGIQNMNKTIDWKEIKDINGDQRKEYLKSICAMNLKKSPGSHTTNNKELSEVANDDKIFLNEQFNIYSPNLIICCGSIVSSLLHNLIDFSTPLDWKMTTRGIWYHEYQKNKYIIQYSHPAARIADCLLYYGLLDAINEIYKNKS